MATFEGSTTGNLAYHYLPDPQQFGLYPATRGSSVGRRICSTNPRRTLSGTSNTAPQSGSTAPKRNLAGLQGDAGTLAIIDGHNRTTCRLAIPSHTGFGVGVHQQQIQQPRSFLTNGGEEARSSDTRRPLLGSRGAHRGAT